MPQAVVIGLSFHQSPNMVELMQRAVALAYIWKDEAFDKLIDTNSKEADNKRDLYWSISNQQKTTVREMVCNFGILFNTICSTEEQLWEAVFQTPRSNQISFRYSSISDESYSSISVILWFSKNMKSILFVQFVSLFSFKYSLEGGMEGSCGCLPNAYLGNMLLFQFFVPQVWIVLTFSRSAIRTTWFL